MYILTNKLFKNRFGYVVRQDWGGWVIDVYGPIQSGDELMLSSLYTESYDDGTDKDREGFPTKEEAIYYANSRQYLEVELLKSCAYTESEKTEKISTRVLKAITTVNPYINVYYYENGTSYGGSLEIHDGDILDSINAFIQEHSEAYEDFKLEKLFI